MSYPFGSGQQPAGYPGGYPPQQGGAPAYPPSHQGGAPGYPPSQGGAPGYPHYQQSGAPGYPPSHHGGALGYPLQQGGAPGYPPQQGYPPAAIPAYPPGQSAALGGFSAQHGGAPGYPPAQHGAYPGHPPQSQAYGYPAQPNYPGAPQSGVPVQTSHQQSSRAKLAPTVKPANPFNSAQDGQGLRKAMKGFGTDENAIIEVLCHRSNDQIQQIKRDYKTSYGKDLVEDIKSESSGNFKKVLVALLTPRVEYYAEELERAMDGVGTDEDTLIEILCSSNNNEIRAITNQYQRMYCKSLESQLQSETSGNFRRLLVSLCSANRDESGHVDRARARQDAKDLKAAGVDKVGTDESVFNAVVCQRNYAQLRLICEEYESLTGQTLLKTIESEFSGDIKNGLKSVVRCVANRPEFFAKCLHNSMAGLGTRDTQLIRVLVTRCEIDLADIKVEFQKKYGKSLRSFIQGDTSGHYKHALYHLIGETQS